jgi:hypothetical protein
MSYVRTPVSSLGRGGLILQYENAGNRDVRPRASSFGSFSGRFGTSKSAGAAIGSA